MTVYTATLGAMLTLSPAPDMTLASAIAQAAEERPILGDAGERTAVLLVSIAWWETGRSFDCTRVGDHGRSVSCFQLMVCPGPRCAELRADTYAAARVARDMLAASILACRAQPVADRLSLYTTGKCQTNRESRVRWGTAARLWTMATS